MALLGALGMVVFVVMFGAWGLSWYGRGLAVATLDMTRQMLFSFIPLSALTVFVGVNMVRMQACHDHRYALAEGLPPLAIILLLWVWQTMDSLPLVAGTLLGTALQALWLARRARSHDGPVGASWRLQSNEWPLVWRSAMIMGLGQLAMSFSTPIDQYFAAGLGTGSIATLGYVNRLISLGMALGATVISRATLPVFSEAVATGQPGRISRLAIRWCVLMALGGLVMACLCYLASPWLVEKLFQRGAFDMRDSVAVADVLRYGVWQWPFYLGGLVLVQYLVATKRYMQVAISGGMAVLGKTLFNAMLVWRMGLSGVVVGSVLMYTVTLLWFVWCTTKKVGNNAV